MRKVRNALIVAPVSVTSTWREAVRVWCPGLTVYDFLGKKSPQRDSACIRAMKNGGICLTTYGTYFFSLVEFRWTQFFLFTQETPHLSKLYILPHLLNTSRRHVWECFAIGRKRILKFQFEENSDVRAYFER